MKVKVFDKNDKGKIEFTRKELEALLNEVFNDGHSEGYKDGYKAGSESNTYTWTAPSITPSITPYTPDYYTTTTCSTDNDTCSHSETYERVYYGIEDDDYVEGQLSMNLTMVK